jgi:dipeptidyl aminopeptidase/acylaminoacyl peptidase
MSASAVGSARKGPERRLTGADLFDLSIASDPQISPDGRHIAYVRRSNDIMTDRAVSSIWLIDTATGEETPIAGPQRRRLFAALVARRQAPRLRLDRGRQRPALGALDEQRRGGPPHRTADQPVEPRLVARRPLDRLYDARQRRRAEVRFSAPANKPEGAKWAEPLEVRDLLAYRADGEGYVEPGFEKIFLVPATGGSPRQLTFGPYHDSGPLSWSRDGRTLYFARTASPIGRMIRSKAKSTRSTLRAARSPR